MDLIFLFVTGNLTKSQHFTDIEKMDDSHILIHQKSAEVINMVLGSLVTMLPYVSFGTLSAYLTVGLPRLLEPNNTGIIIDLHQISWICKF